MIVPYPYPTPHNIRDADSGSAPSNPKKPMASLPTQAEAAALTQLSDAIGEHEAASRYCCGGLFSDSLNKKVAWEPLEGVKDPEHLPTSPNLNSYILRFDNPAEKGTSRNLPFSIRTAN
jgi:hypothetical protein